MDSGRLNILQIINEFASETGSISSISSSNTNNMSQSSSRSNHSRSNHRGRGRGRGRGNNHHHHNGHHNNHNNNNNNNTRNFHTNNYQNNNNNNNSNNNNNNNNNNNRNNFHTKHNNSNPTVIIQGMPRVEFDEWRKLVNSCCKGVRWTSNYCKNGNWHIECADRNTAKQFFDSLNGYVYNGNKLAASFNTPKGPNTRIFNTSLNDNQLQNVLSEMGKRYNQQNQFLDLNRLTQCFNGEKWAVFENTSFTNHVLSIIKQYCCQVITISLNDNNIYTLEPFRHLHNFAPNLQNLSLSNNPIRYISELDHLNGYTNELKELIIESQNMMKEVNNVTKLYVYEITKRFPNLKMLDKNGVKQNAAISFGNTIDKYNDHLNKKETYYFQYNCHNIKPAGDMFKSFISKYFQLFDSQRTQLIDLYHNDCLFSLVIELTDTPCPSSSSNSRSNIFNNNNNNNNNNNKGSDNTRKIIDKCGSLARNVNDSRFNKMNPRKKFEKILHGRINITKYLNDEFPITQHTAEYLTIDIGSPFKVENTDMIQILLIGYYGENNTHARKYQRTWLVVPTNNNGVSSIQILNEQLHIGGSIEQTEIANYPPPASLADSKIEKTKSANSLSNSPQKQNLTSQQQQMILQVSQQAGCNQQIAYSALIQSNWDPNSALNRIKSG